MRGNHDKNQVPYDVGWKEQLKEIFYPNDYFFIEDFTPNNKPLRHIVWNWGTQGDENWLELAVLLMQEGDLIGC
ncbi:Uncharacterized protein APZ42_005960 [Daphnia magna]|uniref:Uncharacterized protein n=1 Tax=Daphnia magna TaxID=35525 RepID=A0A164G5M0_9CRUS|nr:Uncharacterized protein APZ42_005960 [Daphnia magna]